MMIQDVTINMKPFGASFGVADSKEQSAFFKGLAMELKTWKAQSKVQMQFFYVADELTEEEKAILENALSCLWYKSENER